MRVIIAGSRDLAEYTVLTKAIHESGFEITEVVSGRCRGADLLGERWAAKHNIPVTPFPAEWNKFGKKAGMLRNNQMAEYADAAIVAPFKGSRGSANMITTAKTLGLPVYVIDPLSVKSTVVHIGRHECGLRINSGKWETPFHGAESQRSVEEYLRYIMDDSRLMLSLYELDGLSLGCTCAPRLCHGHALVFLRHCQKHNQPFRFNLELLQHFRQSHGLSGATQR